MRHRLFATVFAGTALVSGGAFAERPAEPWSAPAGAWAGPDPATVTEPAPYQTAPAAEAAAVDASEYAPPEPQLDLGEPLEVGDDQAAAPPAPAQVGSDLPARGLVQAQGETEPALAIYDPWERTNRGLFRVHKALDRAVLGPVARGYKRATPVPLQRGVRNFINNLGEPLTFVNDVLQARPRRAARTFARFATNTTIGVGGLFNPAAKLGVPYHYEDFGQTLGSYGMKPGPFLFIPVLGPSSLRDGGGRIVDVVTNPVNVYTHGETASTVKTGTLVMNGVDTRARLDDEFRRTEQTATDEYATLRAAYLQNRAGQIRNGKTNVQDLPDLDEYEPERQPTPTARRTRR